MTRKLKKKNKAFNWALLAVSEVWSGVTIENILAGKLSAGEEA